MSLTTRVINKLKSILWYVPSTVRVGAVKDIWVDRFQPSMVLANKKAWNKVAPLHAKVNHRSHVSLFTDPKYRAQFSNELLSTLRSLPLKNASVFQVGCNNGVELISLQRMGAKHCVGIDISEKFIDQANELNTIAKTTCEFVVGDGLKPSRKYTGKFDLVFVSVGTLPWMIDLQRFFKAMHAVLKPGGSIVINEMHPILHLFEYSSTARELKMVRSYFTEGVHKHRISLDYFGKKGYRVPDQYSKYHTLSEVINGALKSGFMLKSLNEYEYDISLSFSHLQRMKYKFPASYILVARKTT